MNMCFLDRHRAFFFETENEHNHTTAEKSPHLRTAVCPDHVRSGWQLAIGTLSPSALQQRHRERLCRATRECRTPPPEPGRPRNVSYFAGLRSCPCPCQLPQKVLRFLRPSSPSLTRQHHKSCATLFTSEFKVSEFLPAASLLEGCSVCGGALPSWTTVGPDWADQRGVQGQLCPVEQRPSATTSRRRLST